MALTYEAAGTLTFGGTEFTTGEFDRRLGTSGGAKLLSELKRKGVVARTGRGRYRFLAPSERPDLRSLEWSRVRTLLLDGPGPKAWTGPSAVEVWTRGAYMVAPSPFVRLFCLAVPAGSLPRWEAYLRTKGLSTRPRKRIGARIELVPVKGLKPVEVAGEPVVAKRAALALIRERPSVYAGAEELLID